MYLLQSYDTTYLPYVLLQTIGVPTAVVVGLSATGFLSLQKFQAGTLC